MQEIGPAVYRSFEPVFSRIQSCMQAAFAQIVKEKNLFLSYVSINPHCITLQNTCKKFVSLFSAPPAAATDLETLRQDFLTDPEKLRPYSLLTREESEATRLMRPELLSFFHKEPSAQESPETPLGYLRYVSNFLQKHQIAGLSDQAFQAFEQAFKQEEERANWLQHAFGGSEEEQAAALEEATRQMKDALDQLQPKESYIHLASLASPRLHPILQQLLTKVLSEKLSDCLTNQSDVIVETMQKKLLDLFKGMVPEGAATETKSVVAALQESAKHAQKTLGADDSKLLGFFLSSLKEDAKELMGDQFAEFFQTWGDRLFEKEAEEALKNLLSQFLEQQRQLIFRHINGQFNEILAMFPSPVLESLLNIQGELPADKLFWVEVMKEESGTYTVRFFSNALDECIHGTFTQGSIGDGRHNPLVFTGVSPEKINSDFCGRLLSFQAWPLWGQGVQYTFADVHAWLQAELGSPLGVSQASVYPASFPLTSHKKDWLQLYLHHHVEGVEEARFAHLFTFDLPLSMLCDLWLVLQKEPHLLAQDTALQRRIRQTLNELSAEAAALYQAKQISSRSLRSLYATFWEFEQFLEKVAPAPSLSEPRSAALAIPPELQEWIGPFVQEIGGNLDEAPLFGEFLTALLGEDCKEAVSALSRELGAQGTQQREGNFSVSGKWASFRFAGIPALLQQIPAIVPKRLSLLHMYRAYRALSGMLGYLLHLIFYTQSFYTVLCCALLPFFPAGAPYLMVLALATTLLGPDLLRTCFSFIPRGCIDALDALLHLPNELTAYLLKRALAAIFPPLINYWIPQEKLEALRQQIHTWHGQILHQGTLDFKVARSPAAVAKEEPDLLDEAAPAQRAAQAPAVEPPPPPPEIAPVAAGDPLLEHLQECIAIADQMEPVERPLRSDRPISASFYYLNQEIRRFPIPGEEGEGWDIWSQHPEPLALLEKLHKILYRFFNSVSKENHSGVLLSARTEYVVSMYTLYAIIDTLARRIPEARIPKEATPDSFWFRIWIKTHGSSCTQPKTYRQLMALARYFAIDLNSYVDEEITDANRLFSSHRQEIFFFEMTNENPPIDISYYRSLLEDEKVAKRLEMYPMPPHLQNQPRIPADAAKFLLLHEDPPLEETIKRLPEEKREAFQTQFLQLADPSTEDQRHGILPRATYILRFAHNLAWRSTYKSFVNIRDFTRIRNPETEGLMIQPTGVWQSKGGIVDIVCKIWAKSYSFTENMYHPAHQQNLTYAIPAYKICFNGKEPFSYDDTRFQTAMKICLGIDVKQFWVFGWETWNPSVRTQSEIVLAPENYDLPASLEEKKILEMLKADPADQIIRTLDYFLRHKDLLLNGNYLNIFELLIHQTLPLHQQLAQRPAVAKEIGKQLQRLIQHLVQTKRWDVAFDLGQISQNILSHCLYYDPSAAEAFCDLTELTLTQIFPALASSKNRDASRIIKSKLLASYVLLDPEDVPLPKRQQIARVIRRYSSGILSCEWALRKIWAPWIEEDARIDPFYRLPLVSYLASESSEAQKASLQAAAVRTQVPLEQIPHHLALLQWFQPLSTIMVELTEGGEAIEALEFTALKLRYEIARSPEGKERALDQSGEAPGYFIAKEQAHPTLLPHGQYLLLENDKGEQKVHIIPHALEALSGAYLLRQFAHLTMTPWLERQLQAIGPTKTASYKTYTLREGELESSDPEAILYLCFFFLAHGDRERSLRYLEQLKDLGNRTPFASDVFDQMNLFLLPLLLSTAPEAERFLLECMAIKERNILLQHAKPKVPSSTIQCLACIAVQVKYQQYLKRLEAGGTPYLSPYDELFILKNLMRENAQFVMGETFARTLKELHLAWVSEIGLSGITSQLLLLPLIHRRYRFLQTSLEGDSSWKQLAGDLLLNQLFPPPQDAPPLAVGVAPLLPLAYTRKTSLFQLASATARRMKPFWALTTKALSQEEIKEISFAPCDIEALAIAPSTLTPFFIRKHFFSLYRLALGVPPVDWISLEQKELFQRKRGELARLLPTLQGNFENPLDLFFLDLLSALLSAANPQEKGWPAPSLLEESPVVQLPILWGQYKASILPGRIARVGSSVLFSAPSINTVVEMGLGAIKGRVLDAAGIGLLSKLYTAAKSCFSLASQLVPPSFPAIEAPSAFPSSLSPELLQALNTKEGEVSSEMKNLWHPYFIKRPLIARKAEKKARAQETMASVQTSEIAGELEEFYGRDRPLEYRYTLRSESQRVPFLRNLAAVRPKIEKRLETQKRAIEEYVNRSRKERTKTERILAWLQRRSIPKQPLTFQEIEKAWIERDSGSFSRHTDLAPEHLDELEKMLYAHHIEASRWKFFFYRIETIAPKLCTTSPEVYAKEISEETLSELAAECARRRVYVFEEQPYRLLQGKLVFESKTGRLLWSKQAEQMDRLLEKAHPRAVVELIMGSGKTWFGIPFSDFVASDTTQLAINVWPAPLAKTNISTISKQAKTIFGQTARALSITRDIAWTPEKAWALCTQLEQAIADREQINFTKESLQALELSFLERSLDLDQKFSRRQGESRWKETVESLRRALQIVRSQGIGHIDEAHAAFEPHKELNYPLGFPKSLPLPIVEFASEVMLLLLKSPEFQTWLPIAGKMPSPLDPEVFEKEIAPLLAAKVAALPFLKISKQEQEAVALYLQGKAESIPPCVLRSPDRARIDLAKGLISILLPGALSKTINVNFAASLQGNGEYAKPAEGNNNPIESAIIRNPFEALVKTELLLAHHRLTELQCRCLLAYLRLRAEAEARQYEIPLSDTSLARLFAKECPGYAITSSYSSALHESVNRSDRMVLAYATYLIAPEIRYFEQNLSSNAANFASMFARNLSDTGTPFNHGVYLSETTLLSDAGTNGESLDLLLQPGKAAIQILENDSPAQVLEEIVTTFLHSDPKGRAIIDRGAVFNGISNETVAKRLLQAVIDSKRDDIDGIAFYSQQELVILERGASKPIPIDQSTIPIHRRLSYFPQPQTFGADIPQIEEAVGLITIGEDIRFHELTQAIWRMRGLRGKQTLRFAMTQRVQEKISGREEITIQDIIAFSKANEERELLESHYESDQKKLSNVIRRAVLDKMLAAPDADTFFKILRAFAPLFVKTIRQDPTLLFGHIDRHVSPHNILAKLLEEQYEIIKDSRFFSREEKEAIYADLTKQIRGKYPELVHIYEREGILSSSCLEDLNQAVHIEQNAEQEEHVEQKEEQEINVQQQSNLEQKSAPIQSYEEAQIFQPWDPSLNPTQLGEWFQITPVDGPAALSQKNPPIFSLYHILANDSRHEVRNIAPGISNLIFASNNTMYLQAAYDTSAVEPFGRNQIPLFEALLIQNKEWPFPMILLVSQEEARYWRAKLAEDRDGKHTSDETTSLCLFDLTTQIIVAEGRRPFDQQALKTPPFQKALAQLLFLRGDTAFAEESLYFTAKDWIKTNLAACNEYVRHIATHHATRPLASSPLEFLLFQLQREQEESLMLKV